MADVALGRTRFFRVWSWQCWPAPLPACPPSDSLCHASIAAAQGVEMTVLWVHTDFASSRAQLAAFGLRDGDRITHDVH